MSNSEARWERLESQLAYQEELIQALQRQLFLLEEQCSVQGEILRQMAQQLAGTPGLAPASPIDDIPPHY